MYDLGRDNPKMVSQALLVAIALACSRRSQDEEMLIPLFLTPDALSPDANGSRYTPDPAGVGRRGEGLGARAGRAHALRVVWCRRCLALSLVTGALHALNMLKIGVRARLCSASSRDRLLHLGMHQGHVVGGTLVEEHFVEIRRNKCAARVLTPPVLLTQS